MSRVRIKTLSLWSEHCVAVDVRITSLRVKVSRQCNHFGFEIAFDQMDLKRKYLIFSLVLILVLSIVVAITVGSAQSGESGQRNITGNDTEDVSIGAIGRYAPRRQSYGYDQNGKLRQKW